MAIEVKATASPDRSDAKHLFWLRDQLGDRFLAGAVLHTDPLPFHLDDRIAAVPIASLWVPGDEPTRRATRRCSARFGERFLLLDNQSAQRRGPVEGPGSGGGVAVKVLDGP